ncbi:class I SAM-dependent methyltransferase [Rhodospira trueperi]|uniref:Ubiquinone/menaquinone biosynthesis C-methylase UbiE n=1 Tax=Rhodospira trueperi TaxID=69960 RepID=A0A1G7DIJ4_9PROT|nr:class I SAM-dependent methyltransferase [Rhodospira trueperi]SDE51321.1 Ubiquinone/menaquinone biosynthesis C-methylase UbiE [Rhodospira trueperi]
MNTLSRSPMDRLVDAIARRPNGPIGRALYRRPVGHVSGFRKALEMVPVTETDRILDVGCGGGMFLEMALSQGCRAAGLDHSVDMVADTRTRNARAATEGRLEVVQGDAAALPFPDSAFNAVFCLNAFFFFPEPAAAIAEMARVLAPGGRVAIITAPPTSSRWIHRLFGPIARRMRFDAPEALAHWAEEAGLDPGAVRAPDAASMLFVAGKPTARDQSPTP